MKRSIGILTLALAIAAPGFAQWLVVDVAAIQQSVMNYGALVEQISNQATQISNQVRQIQQIETQLSRMGDLANVRSIVGFPELRVDIDLPTRMKKWADGRVRVDGRGIFGDTRGGIYGEVTVDFPDFDGAPIARSPEIYKQPHDVIVTVDEFKEVQDDVYTRREELKRAIARTSDAMRGASTEAEQLKLQTVLHAQYSQLASVDAEIALSAAQVQVKTAEAAAMSDAQSKAESEARRRIAQREVEKLRATFKPRYECPLQFVTERRLSP